METHRIALYFICAPPYLHQQSDMTTPQAVPMLYLETPSSAAQASLSNALPDLASLSNPLGEASHLGSGAHSSPLMFERFQISWRVVGRVH
jgi:hypothetical protein